MPEQQHEHDRLLKLAAWASVSVAATLIAIKLVAWQLTGSASLLASLVDSLMDLAASGINFMAIRYSLKGADADHRFGHGKAESLAGLAQASFIAGSAVFLLLYTGSRLLEPRPLTNIDTGLTVMLISLALTIALVLFQRHVIRQTGSLAIRADSLHYLTDILTILVTISALFLAGRGLIWADPLLALAISFYILHCAGRIVIAAIQDIMDRELAPEIKEQIRAIALQNREVLGIHDLRTRQSGRTRFIQFHLDLPPQLPLQQSHAIGKEIERNLLACFPDADIIIHQDPASAYSPCNPGIKPVD